MGGFSIVMGGWAGVLASQLCLRAHAMTARRNSDETIEDDGVALKNPSASHLRCGKGRETLRFS